MDEFNQEALQKFTESLRKLLTDAVMSFAEILRKIRDGWEISEEKPFRQPEAERCKWRLPRSQEPRFLYLDKRTKVYRCRNSCRKKKRYRQLRLS